MCVNKTLRFAIYNALFIYSRVIHMHEDVQDKLPIQSLTDEHSNLISLGRQSATLLTPAPKSPAENNANFRSCLAKSKCSMKLSDLGYGIYYPVSGLTYYFNYGLSLIAITAAILDFFPKLDNDKPLWLTLWGIQMALGVLGIMVRYNKLYDKESFRRPRKIYKAVLDGVNLFYFLILPVTALMALINPTFAANAPDWTAIPVLAIPAIGLISQVIMKLLNIKDKKNTKVIIGNGILDSLQDASCIMFLTAQHTQAQNATLISVWAISLVLAGMFNFVRNKYAQTRIGNFDIETLAKHGDFLLLIAASVAYFSNILPNMDIDASWKTALYYTVGTVVPLLFALNLFSLMVHRQQRFPHEHCSKPSELAPLLSRSETDNLPVDKKGIWARCCLTFFNQVKPTNEERTPVLSDDLALRHSALQPANV
jgi:hypothetical protein